MARPHTQKPDGANAAGLLIFCKAGWAFLLEFTRLGIHLFLVVRAKSELLLIDHDVLHPVVECGRCIAIGCFFGQRCGTSKTYRRCRCSSSWMKSTSAMSPTPPGLSITMLSGPETTPTTFSSLTSLIQPSLPGALRLYLNLVAHALFDLVDELPRVIAQGVVDVGLHAGTYTADGLRWPKPRPACPCIGRGLGCRDD